LKWKLRAPGARESNRMTLRGTPKAWLDQCCLSGCRLGTEEGVGFGRVGEERGGRWEDDGKPFS
jgi:hypothetical protein